MIYLFFLLSFHIDFARFSLPRGGTFCEVYYSLSIEKSNFVEKSGKYTADFSVLINVKDRKSEEVYVDTIARIINSSELQDTVSFSDVLQVNFLPGREYKISLSVLDLKEGIYEADTTIRAPDWKDNLNFSDIQISHTIIGTDEQNRFVKNGFKLLPYPERKFNRTRYTLTSYSELYNIKEDSVLVEFVISNGLNVNDTVMSEYYQVTGGDMVIPGLFNVLGYPPGEYYLTVTARSSDSRTEASKWFSIAKKRFEGRELASIPDSIIEYASFINYLASPGEIKEYNSVSKESKKYFLAKFWSKRDPTPETEENEALEEFIKRIKDSDEKFSKKHKKGRRTDRGRIYIKYGQPDDVLRRTSDMSYDPYLLWHYFNTDDWFIFMDRNLTGDYELIYSSVETEPTDAGWQNLIMQEDVNRVGGGF